MKLISLFILLFNTVNSQTCLVGPYSSTCLWCPVGLTATLGAPNATANPLQSLQVGPWSRDIEIGNNTIRRIWMGVGGVPEIIVGRFAPAPTTQRTYFGYGATEAYFGSRAGFIGIGDEIGAGDIRIGSVTPTPSPTQVVQIGRNSLRVYLGEIADMADIFTNPRIVNFPHVFIGRETVYAPSVTETQRQYMRFGRYAREIDFGTYTNRIYIGTQPGGIPPATGIGYNEVIIGAISAPPTPSLKQAVVVGSYAAQVNMGDHASSFNSFGTFCPDNYFGHGGQSNGNYIGCATENPTAGNLMFINRDCGNIRIGTNAISGTVTTIGRSSVLTSPSPRTFGPTLAPAPGISTLIEMNGLYHYTFSAQNTEPATGSPVALSWSRSISTNMPTAWHDVTYTTFTVQQSGHYLVCVTFKCVNTPCIIGPNLGGAALDITGTTGLSSSGCILRSLVVGNLISCNGRNIDHAPQQTNLVISRVG